MNISSKISSKKRNIPVKNKLEKFNPINIDLIAKKVEHESALIRIGKNGLSDNIIEELKRLIKQKKAVKVKILQNSPIENPKEFFGDLEKTIGFKVWRIKGNTGIFIFRKISS